MPDSLDPTDAFFSAFSGAFARFGGLVGASLSGHVLAVQVRALAEAIVSVPTVGMRALLGWVSLEPVKLIFSWLGTLVQSVGVGWCWPLLLLEVWLLGRLRSGGEVFPVVLAFALVQPVHSFLALQWFTPAGGLELALGCGLLLGCTVTVGALLLWWRRTGEESPVLEEEGEPEL